MSKENEVPDDVESLMASLDHLGVENTETDSKPEEKEPTEKNEQVNAPENEKEILDFLDELENEKREAAYRQLSEGATQETSKAPAESKEKSQNEPSDDRTSKRFDTQYGREGNETPKEENKNNWFGGLWSSASAAVRSAEQHVRSIKNHEETAHWDSQVRKMMDLNKLGDIGNGIRSKALPTLSNTFQNVMNVVAPPIQDHEVLQVMVFHDLAGFSHVDRIVYDSFDNVMSQVEGGDLTVLLDKEAKVRSRTGDLYENFALCNGLLEAKKLAKENLVQPIRHAKKYVEESNSAKSEEENSEKKEGSSIRVTHLLLSIQAFTVKSKEISETEQLCFLLCLKDVSHDLEFFTTSQPIPLEWHQWAVDNRYIELFGPTAILPNEWANQWTENCISVAAGILAQMYTSKRMALGDPALFATLEQRNEVEEKEQQSAYFDGLVYT
ncbi:Golgi protein, associated with COP vesicles (predicted), DUF5427 [Schizosaccharomyces osmophilus]|uniref:Golgi protein, associated with COP vesicles (Predicted), DUF5427 n=1 Tax=Schizosaccharomyces osmophilus TaxID=2545709 RepID=A0AAE9WGD0_9SCHI|nr:Golgi protein, associated with COP vesicles (predicted), DUF5427 [Schizosaccharomyces osmophilus]WBW75144.1 Golgi protein, associated with COP vesicles (predicted), DUF5427 [Schizosaccharomyces osmophilus]